MNGLKKLKQHIEILSKDLLRGMRNPGADLLRASIAEAEKEQLQMMDEMYGALHTAYSYMKNHELFAPGYDDDLVTGALEKAEKFIIAHLRDRTLIASEEVLRKARGEA